MKYIAMNRGFVQIPILITLFASLVLLSSIGYFAYEAGQKSPTHTQKSTSEAVDMEIGTGATPVPIETNKVQVKSKAVEAESSASKNMSAPASNNLDSTCLSFYEKMKSLDVLPVKQVPVYTQAELKAIEMAGKGEYDPALPSAQAKVSVAEASYQNAIRANIAQKQSLSIKYAFCYEYLAKTYGFVIE